MLNLPNDVLEWVKNHFSQCNDEVAHHLSSFPAAYEEHLDMNLISYWSKRQAPVKLPSNWVIKVDINFMGGGRHYGAWEVADLGIIIIFRKRGQIIRSKMAFVQSKKLYADTVTIKPNRNELYGYGMGTLLNNVKYHQDLIKPVTYKFEESSRYQAFKIDSEQQQAMGAFQRKYGMKMYYLFYNPLNVPHEVSTPISTPLNLSENKVGCRIMRKEDIDYALNNYGKGYKPTYGDIKYLLPIEFNNQHEAGWRLEYFIVDLMMGCKEGVIDDSPNFNYLLEFMNQKSRPMASSLAITFDINE